MNRDGHNPILTAIRSREPRLVDYMISACNDSEHLEKALREKARDGTTCLHAAFQAPLPLSIIRRLIGRASDEVLAVQDDRGRTPMHVAVSYAGVCSDPGTELMALLIYRDLKAPRNDPRRQETFLDLRTTAGRSVYRDLEHTRANMIKKYEACQVVQHQETDNRTKQSQGDAVKAAPKSGPREEPRDSRQGGSTEPVDDHGSTDKQGSKAADCGMDKREQPGLERKAEEAKILDVGKTKRPNGVDAPARNGVGERDSDSMELGDEAYMAVMPGAQALRAGREGLQHEPAPNTPIKRRVTARFDANPDQEQELERGRMNLAATKPRDSKGRPDPMDFLPGRIKNASAILHAEAAVHEVTEFPVGQQHRR